MFFLVNGNIMRGTLFSLVVANIIALPNSFLRFVMIGNLLQELPIFYSVNGVMPLVKHAFFCLFAHLLNVNGSNPNHSGKVHVGLGNAYLYDINIYTVRGRVVKLLKVAINVLADINMGFREYYSLEAMMYKPDYSVFYRLGGCIGLLSRTVYMTKSNMQQEAMRVIKQIGNLTVSFITYYTVFAFMLENVSKVIYILGKVLANYSRGYKVSSYCHGFINFMYRCRSICKANYVNIFTLNGSIGVLLEQMVSIKGIILGNVNAVYKLVSELLNDKGDWFLKITGMLTPITRAFVFSVPVRNQQFITNKQWFKN